MDRFSTADAVTAILSHRHDKPLPTQDKSLTRGSLNQTGTTNRGLRISSADQSFRTTIPERRSSRERSSSCTFPLLGLEQVHDLDPAIAQPAAKGNASQASLRGKTYHSLRCCLNTPTGTIGFNITTFLLPMRGNEGLNNTIAQSGLCGKFASHVSIFLSNS